MGRTKGSRNKNRGAVSDEKAAAILKEREANLHKSPILTPLATNDKKYLLEMLMIFVENTLPLVPEGEMENSTAKFRFTPRTMFENICKYLKLAIENGQPLAITSMARFAGLSRAYFLGLTEGKVGAGQTEFPAGYEFLKECRSFVEEYNEYALHKKQNPAGPIFVLKNFGWKDKLEIEATANQGALTEEEREAAQKRISSFSESGGKI